MKCPKCGSNWKQYKAGFNPSGSQRYRCGECNRVDKQETYSVEAVKADLRHYLKRLARRARCFTRRMHALAKNIQLFVYCYNHRQLAKRLFPKYSFHLLDFLSLLL